MKKYIAFLITALLLLSLVACTGSSNDVANRDQDVAEDSGLTIHKIGVATYNVKDAQVMMFKDYLDNYIKPCFADVTFLYSDSISGIEDMLDFLSQCAENGVEGVMIFGSNDLVQEVEFCAEHGMYVIRPSGTSADAVFDAVADNPYFVGEIGPGAENEYGAAADMTRALAGEEKSYVILSSGASRGNEMHRLRTLAVLDVLQEVHGVTLPQSSEELAVVTETTAVEAGGLRLVICPGYLEGEGPRMDAAEVISTWEYTTVLSVVPATPVIDALDSVQAECGVVDCFSEDNYYGFQKGKISYVAGKYQSEIGPGFAALYNAITGSAEAFRVDGKAFHLEQGFWSAASEAEYDSKYALASGIAINAYNYKDLYSVIKSITPEADFEAFKALTESWRYEDCLARRST